MHPVRRVCSLRSQQQQCCLTKAETMRSAHWISARSASSACVIVCVNLRVAVFLLVSVILRARAQCPAQCRCPSYYVVNCASLALTKVPTDRFDRYVQNLDISDNDLVSIDKTSLRDTGVVTLVQLNASRNYITKIHEDAFLGQRKLQTVDFSSNSLVYIEPKTFMRNPSLERLSLSNNQHLTLPEGGPFLYSKSLRVLQLSNCDLSHIPPTTFRDLLNLQELDISHNKIEILNPLQSVRLLTTLDISHNYLRGFNSDIFTASPKLIYLNFSFNNFSTLNVTVLPQLAKAISSTDLNGNPWVCDCVMFEAVYSWCRNNSVELELVCSSPPKFKDKPWTTYENAGCDDYYDDDDDTDSADLVGNIIFVGDKLSHRSHDNYAVQMVPDSVSKRNKEQPRTTNINYFLICIALFVALLCLLPLAYVLWYRFRSRKLRRTGPAQSDAEICHLSNNNI